MSQVQWEFQSTNKMIESLPKCFGKDSNEPGLLIRGIRCVSAISTRAWLKLYHRIEITGRGNLPSDGSFVIIGNHASHLDVLCLLAALPLEQIPSCYPLAAEDYFFKNRLRIVASFLFLNAMPFCRRHHVRQSIERCRHALRQDGTVLILFPEGTRSPDGNLQEFRPGIGSLVAGLDVPVVPCAIHGSHRAMAKGSILPRPTKLRLKIGTPRSFESVARNKQSARVISQELHEAVKELL
jgi:1-acyl-sn-glycerol-3-phosphate acyltransferase